MNAAYAKRKADTLANPLPPGDPRHGTINGYGNLRCRCSACRAANVVFQREARARRKKLIQPDDPRHGDANFYANHSCRCGPCTEAHNAESARRAANRRARR